MTTSVDAIAAQLLQAQAHYQAGRFAEAEAGFRAVVEAKPQQTEAWFWLALTVDQLGRPADSVSYYEHVLALDPQSAEAHGNLGSVFLKLGRYEAAIAHHRQSLELIPDNAKAHYNLAIALYEHNQVDEAITYYQRAIELMPEYANAHHNLGMALYRQGQTPEAIAAYRTAIELEPNHASARNSLGVALYQANQVTEAIEQYRAAIALQPGYVNAYDNLGIALKQQGNLAEAAENFQKAIALRPGYANAYVNLGNTMRDLHRYQEAIAYCQEAVRLAPTNADAHNTYGCVLVDLSRFTEAIACYEAAIAHRPDFADAHLNLGIILLQIGDFQRGFQEYHWRWQTKQCPDLRYTQALWDGAELGGKTILLTAEQGFGDTIQFARYAPLVTKRGGRVVIACQKPLLRLLATIPGVTYCADRDRDNVEIHTHAPLLELPYILGTTLATIPAQVPYIFPPHDTDIHLTAPAQTRLKIGFVWATNPTNSTASKRSCPVAHFLGLLDLPEVALYSLQKDVTEADAALLPDHPHFQALAPQLTDFADTAAAIAQLDLVITVDTSVAHLAGALGKPTWTLLPHVADWRWLTDRDDSPWYPTMRLFRQSQPGDWAELFSRVRQALEAELAKPHPLADVIPLSPQTVSLTSPKEPQLPQIVPTVPISSSALPPAPPFDLPGFNRIKPCRHGVFLYDVSDLRVGRSLDLYGEWLESNVNLFQSLVQLGHTVVEIGAGIGAETVVLAKIVGLNGKVFAIEPQRMTFQTLCANLALNSITNTYSYQVAIGETPGFIPASQLQRQLQPSLRAGAGPTLTQVEQVQVAVLDSFGIPQCRLLKLAVGPMLEAALQGALQTLERCQPIVYIANNDAIALEPRTPLGPALLRLRSLGYALYAHQPPLYNANNFRQNSHNVFTGITQHNVLAFPSTLNITVNGLAAIALD